MNNFFEVDTEYSFKIDYFTKTLMIIKKINIKYFFN